MRLPHLAVYFLAVLAGSATAQTVHTEEPTQVISQFSGKPVPRFESLRFEAANGRRGPSLDQPILWRYERSGLPVLIIKESQDWRRVRDPDGVEVWISARMLSARRTVMVRTETILRKSASDEAAGVAVLRPGVIAILGQCTNGWCRLDVSDRQGWTRQAALWGADPYETVL